MNNKICVIVPVYNCEKYLNKCLESILNQTYQNFELIIVCDKGNDNSHIICQDFANKYADKIKLVIRESGKGVGNARNVGIELIGKDCDYVSFIDSDDRLEKNFYEVLINNLLKYDADISICSYKWEKDNNRNIKNKKEKIQIFNKINLLKEAFLYRYFIGALWCKLLKVNLIKDLRFDENLNFMEDFKFSFQYMSKCEKAVFSNLKLYHYIKNKKSLTFAKTSDKKIACLDMLKEINQYCQTNYPELVVYSNANLFMHAVEQTFFFKRANDCVKYTLEYLETIVKDNYNSFRFVKKKIKSFRRFAGLAGRLLVKNIKRKKRMSYPLSQSINS